MCNENTFTIEVIWLVCLLWARLLIQLLFLEIACCLCVCVYSGTLSVLAIVTLQYIHCRCECFFFVFLYGSTLDCSTVKHLPYLLLKLWDFISERYNISSCANKADLKLSLKTFVKFVTLDVCFFKKKLMSCSCSGCSAQKCCSVI